jgi:COP9 signalosome complex subunit 2
MSDDDFMLESDNEDYEFDYEDDGEEESADVDIENRYYNAKQLKASDPEAAINEFLEVVKSEQEKGDWSVLSASVTSKFGTALNCKL